MMSKFVPGGMKMFNNVDATKSSVINGTPRMNSMNPTQTILSMIKSDWRPKASKMPIGKDNAIPTRPIVIESMKPPNFADSTVSIPIGMMPFIILAKSPAAKSHHMIGAKTSNMFAINAPACSSVARNKTQPITNPRITEIGNQSVPPQSNHTIKNG